MIAEIPCEVATVAATSTGQRSAETNSPLKRGRAVNSGYRTGFNHPDRNHNSAWKTRCEPAPAARSRTPISVGCPHHNNTDQYRHERATHCVESTPVNGETESPLIPPRQQENSTVRQVE